MSVLSCTIAHKSVFVLWIVITHVEDENVVVVAVAVGGGTTREEVGAV
jgi:hypothetical protein